ncbi:MAG: DUF1254 domain-containing protein [Rhodoferax sp.]
MTQAKPDSESSTAASRQIFHRIWTRLRRALLLTLLLLVGVGTVLYVKSEMIVLGAEAYIYGYPLVITDVTRANAALTIGPENELHRVRRFPDASFKDVVRPNVDTLYTTAFINTAKGPWVFEMAANDQRYEVMPFMDGWTNVFATPGTRTTGKQGGKFLLVGPGWQGQTPAGLTLMQSPTQMVWLIGRTQTNGIADYALVHGLQAGIRLRSLNDWQADKPESRSNWQPSSVKPIPAPQQMQGMDVQAFFTRLALLMVNSPPVAADGPMVAKLARIGIAPGQPPDWSLLDRWSVGLGRWLADFTVARELKKPRDTVRGWSTPPAILGNYGTSYNIRAVVAMVGLGANLPADAIYPNTSVDQTGARLNGKHRYRLHFNASDLPPVNAFWSVTAYGADDLLIDNLIKRHALGDRDPLVFNTDGSLDLWIQADRPSPDKERNWLPVKSGADFLLNARLYWPREPALNGAWGMPSVDRIDN